MIETVFGFFWKEHAKKLNSEYERDLKKVLASVGIVPPMILEMRIGDKTANIVQQFVKNYSSVIMTLLRTGKCVSISFYHEHVFTYFKWPSLKHPLLPINNFT